MSKRQRLILILGGSVVILTALLLILFLVVLPLLKNVTEENRFQINNVSIQINGNNVEEQINIKFTEDDFIFDVVINNHEDDNKNIPLFEWAIVSEDRLNCEISNSGVFIIGDTLGALTIQVTVTSKNTMSAELKIKVIAPDSYLLDSIEVVTPEKGFGFIEGQQFECAELQVKANFLYDNNDVQVFVSDFFYSKTGKLNANDTEIDISFIHNGEQRVVSVPLVVEPKKLQSIEILKAPNVTNYIEGQYFDAEGIEVLAHYEYLDEIIDDFIIIGADAALSTTVSSVDVIYTNSGITKRTLLNIVVEPRKLQSILIDSEVKVNYIQGQAFRKEGLKVLARYEYFDREITSEVILSKSAELFHTDESITISYTEGTVTKNIVVPIVVKKPYEEVRKIVFENPLDATLSWIYQYVTDEGEKVIDNTDLEGNESLQFDILNGIYVAPVGATITLLRVNPIVTDFVINGKKCILLYPENSIDFELDFGTEDVLISFSKVIGDKITVRFAMGPNQNNWAFIYPINYNNKMRANDLAQISKVYEDTQTFFFNYRIGENNYSFFELSAVIINSNTLISVSRIERTQTDLITLKVQYPENIVFSFIVNRQDAFAFDKLPRVNRVGYTLEFSLTLGGLHLDKATFANWLLSASNEEVVYAAFKLNVATVTGEIIGTWVYEHSSLENNFSLTLIFNTDGTYSYQFILNGSVNCEFTGIYETINNQINILSVESNAEYQLITLKDFEVSLNESELKATLFVIEEHKVMKGSLTLKKAP